MPVRDFFKTILEHSSHHSLNRFNVERGELRVQYSEWAPPDPPEEY